jgi:hypothetical protein
MNITKIGRRLTTGAMAVLMALGLALGAFAFAPEGADALPTYDPTGDGASCRYARLVYSHGSVIRQGDGNFYKCSNGRWDRYA